MNIKVIKTKKLGLEVYNVFLNGTLVHTYLSREIALTAAKRLENKIRSSF
jgi:hypothetical protein